MQVHTWVNPFCFGNNRFSRTTDMGENVPHNWFFCFGVFWEKNFKVIFGTPFSIEKVKFIFVVRPRILWKIVMCSKNYFLRLFWKILLFLKKIVIWKIFKPAFLTKKFILIFPSPQNGHVFPKMFFQNFFNINWRTSARFSCSKVHWEGIFTTLRNLFRIFMFYILKSTYLYRGRFKKKKNYYI